MCYQLLYEYNQPLELSLQQVQENLNVLSDFFALIDNKCYYIKHNHIRIKLIAPCTFTVHSKIKFLTMPT